MTRIVAGRAGGRRLAVPPKVTRPTSDRVREALFSALDARIDLDGAVVLDLFAGSGALALEALSRGAAHATLVEADTRAASVIRSNIVTVGLPGARVRVGRVASVLDAGADRRYDLVFADPPYAIDDDEVVAMLDALCDGGWLAQDALVVVERSARAPELRWPDALSPEWDRRYGDTRVDIACYGLPS